MRQVAALPYRLQGGDERPCEILLITSSNGDWLIPKGDIEEGMSPSCSAEKEAFEEGGVRGQAGELRIGSFRYCKERNGAAIMVEVDVFALEVLDELPHWPEMKIRKRRWLSQPEAAETVGEEGLASILRAFRP
jgi:8-oxo-dGTP pyrophosphatase MutT (NUDIX family)